MTRDIIPLFRSCTTVLRPSTAAAVEIDSGLSISDNEINPVLSVPVHAMPLLRNETLKTRRQDCVILRLYMRLKMSSTLSAEVAATGVNSRTLQKLFISIKNVTRLLR